MSKFLGHNFGIVYRFEVARMLKKKSFWLSIIILPVALVAVFLVMFWANGQSDAALEKAMNEQINLAVYDESGLVDKRMLSSMSARAVDDNAAAINDVKAGKYDVYIHYPKDLAKAKVEVYAQNAGLFDNSKYESIASTLIKNSTTARVSQDVVVVLTDKVTYDSTYYKDGAEYNPLAEAIIPGVFLVLFYVIVCVYGGQMMNSTVEEKENRVIEMILTMIKSRTLIIGKIFAYLTLILLQIVIILALIVAVYFVLREPMSLPSLDKLQVAFNPITSVIALLLFISSILLFSGILVAIGAIAPSAKEAGSYFTVPILLIFAPLYATPIFLTTELVPAAMFLMYFPLTAPIPLMIRNATGNLGIGEATLGIAIMLATAILVFWLAAKMFQLGAVQYDKRLSFKTLFAKKRA